MAIQCSSQKMYENFFFFGPLALAACKTTFWWAKEILFLKVCRHSLWTALKAGVGLAVHVFMPEIFAKSLKDKYFY